MQESWYYWVLGAMLAAAALDDAITGKVRNTITLPCIVVGLLGHAVISGGLGLQGSALGLAAGFFPAFVVWKLGGIGGGDVKLLAAVGALTGWRFVLTAMFFGLGVAVLMAVVMLIAGRQLIPTFRRLGIFAYLRASGADTPVPTGKASRKLPFGLALCVGCAIVMILELVGVHCRFIWI